MGAIRIPAETLEAVALALEAIAQHGEKFSTRRAIEALEVMESGLASVQTGAEVIVGGEHERLAVSLLTAFLTGVDEGQRFALLAEVLSEEVSIAPDPAWVVSMLAAMARVACDTVAAAIELEGGTGSVEAVLDALRRVAGEQEGFWEGPENPGMD